MCRSFHLIAVILLAGIAHGDDPFNPDSTNPMDWFANCMVLAGTAECGAPPGQVTNCGAPVVNAAGTWAHCPNSGFTTAGDDSGVHAIWQSAFTATSEMDGEPTYRFDGFENKNCYDHNSCVVVQQGGGPNPSFVCMKVVSDVQVPWGVVNTTSCGTMNANWPFEGTPPIPGDGG